MMMIQHETKEKREEEENLHASPIEQDDQPKTSDIRSRPPTPMHKAL